MKNAGIDATFNAMISLLAQLAIPDNDGIPNMRLLRALLDHIALTDELY